MLLDEAALCKQAVMFESKELKEIKFHPAFMSELETLLLDVYASLLPGASEYEQRKMLVQLFNTTAKNIFGDTGGFPIVVAFGSFIMNLFTAKSDLDLSINFSSSNAACLRRDKAVSILRRFAKVLRKKRSMGHLSSVLQILHARVPVLKAVDSKTGIECDISIENKDGISRSLFFSIVSSIDERFHIMSYLMKAWAKANDINSSKDHTMNSLTIISLVALHFQTRDPPILPPFSTLLRDGTDFSNLDNVVLELTKCARRNTESVAELFVSLLAKLTSVEKLWELGLCASNFEGSWISKTWCSKFGSNMNVEDFLDRTQNFARSVGKSEMPKIYNCFHGSLQYLSRSMQGQIEISALGTLLFGSISLHTNTSTNADMTINQKLPIKYIQPHVDGINPSNHTSSTAGTSLERRPTSTKSGQYHANINPVLIKNQKLPIESIQPPIDIISENNLTNTTSGVSLKRKQTSTKPTRPCVVTNQTPIDTRMTYNPKPPGIEINDRHVNTITLEPKLPILPHIKNIPPKRPCYAGAAGALPIRTHQNQNYMYFPTPMMHPAPSYVPPPNRIVHSNVSGYQPPLTANTGHRSLQPIHRPLTNHFDSASLHRHALQYGPIVPTPSGMIPYYPNPLHPMSLDGRHPSLLHDYNNNNTAHPQFFGPPR